VRRRCALLGAAAGALSLGGPARAQGGGDFPSRAVSMVVAFPPGGQADVVARPVAAALERHWRQPVPVVNRPGASGEVGNASVARAAPDGYTLLMAAAGEIAANPALFRQRMTYDPVRELAPVSLVATVPNLLVVNPRVPVRTPAELVAHAKASPGRLSYASSGIGNPQHLAGELLNRMAGTDILHVPYRGAAPALTDVAAGHVTMNFSSLGPALPLIQDGKLRAVAVTSREHMPQLPEVPALAEAPGLAEYELLNWFGLFAPAATPAPAVARLHETAAAALRDPGLAAKLTEQGAIPRALAPAEFRAFVEAETRKFTRIIEDANITPEG
jgi:tripartite-type tricarboxylate transporter receptor subunit TctC